MHLCLPTVGPDAAKDAVQKIGAGFCSLGIHCLSHDRAPASEDLEIGHGSSTGRNMASGRGERSKCGGRGLVEEGAHGAGLPEEGLHCGDWSMIDVVELLSGFHN